MNWIIKIENEPKQRIKVTFLPLAEIVTITGEFKSKNDWVVFSSRNHNMKIDLEQLQIEMSRVVEEMRKRINEYENLNKGFSVIKEVAFDEEED